jgi:hypothetical protein
MYHFINVHVCVCVYRVKLQNILTLFGIYSFNLNDIPTVTVTFQYCIRLV